MSKENETPEDGVNDDDALAALAEASDEVTYTEEVENENGKTEDADGADAPEDGDAGSGESDVPADGESGTSDEGDKENESGRESPDEEADRDETDGESSDGDDAATDGDGRGDDEDAGDESAGDGDHINDPIPEGTNERTSRRIQSLISDVKELSTARDERDAFMQAITETGATPEQYAGSLTVLRLYNSDSIEDKKKALEIIRGMERDLAFETGEGQAHVKLSDYPDLQGEVEAGTLSEERAIELATVRARDAHMGAKREQQNEQAQSQQQTQQLVEQGKAALNTLGQELMADPAYKTLYPQFTKMLNTTLRRVHPTEWGAVARETWTTLKAAQPAASATGNTGSNTGNTGSKPKNQPLRPKSGSSSSNKASEADSALAAMEGALDGL